MDNPTRSERTRTAAIQAALAILERDGPGKLTFDAISRESGISKGGLMHQFRTKGDVLNALMDSSATARAIRVRGSRRCPRRSRRCAK